MYVLFHICVKTDFVDFNESCGLMTCTQNNMEMDWSLYSALMYSFVVDLAQTTNKLTS